MKLKVKFAVLSAVVLGIALCSIHAAAQPTPDVNYFRGTVTIGGYPVPDGLKVSARIDGVECDYAITVDGKYGYGLTQDPEVLLKVMGSDNDTVEFFVEGVKANETATWEAGHSTLDLTVPPFLHYYSVTCASYAQKVGAEFTVNVRACDPCGNEVIVGSPKHLTLTSSSATMLFDADGDGSFGDDVKILSGSSFDIVARGTTVASGVTINVTDGDGKMGTSPEFTISDQGGWGEWWWLSWTIPLGVAAALAVAVTFIRRRKRA